MGRNHGFHGWARMDLNRDRDLDPDRKINDLEKGFRIRRNRMDLHSNKKNSHKKHKNTLFPLSISGTFPIPHSPNFQPLAFNLQLFCPSQHLGTSESQNLYPIPDSRACASPSPRLCDLCESLSQILSILFIHVPFPKNRGIKPLLHFHPWLIFKFLFAAFLLPFFRSRS